MGRAIVGVLGVLFGLIASFFGAATLLDAGGEERRTVRPLPTLGDPLALDVHSGDVTVRTGAGPARVAIEERRGLLGGPEVRVERREDGTLSVDAACAWFLLNGCPAQAELTVPERTAVRLETGSGDVTVAGLRGDTWVATGSGSVTLTDVEADRLRARTGSGDVRAVGAAAADVVLDTGSGTIDVALTRPPRSVEVETGSGDLTLTVPDASYRVEAETGSGDEDVQVRQDPNAPRRLRLETGSGDLAVRAVPDGR